MAGNFRVEDGNCEDLEEKEIARMMSIRVVNINFLESMEYVGAGNDYDHTRKLFHVWSIIL